MKRRFVLRALTLPPLAAAPPAAAQGGGRTLRIVVGFPPGQGIDLVGRVIAEQLRLELGDTAIVDNRPGQGGSMAMGQVARAAPDGTTVMLSALASLAITPHLYGDLPYDPLRSFEPVALIGDLPLLLVANPSVPVDSLAALVAYAKANPDKLAHPSSGNGTVSHLAMEELKRAAGVRILHVPYQGSARAMTDLVAGNVAVAFDTIAATGPHVAAGKLRLLAAGSAARLPAYPDTPTVAELGYPGFEANAWIGILAPAGTQAAAVDRLASALERIVRSPQIAERFASLGAIPRPLGPAAFRAFLAAEHARWSRIVRESGVKPD